MTPEERALLRDTAELVKENHLILKSMRRNARIASFLRVIYWLIILGTAFGTYYFIQPYIDPLLKFIDSSKSNVQILKDALTRVSDSPVQSTPKQ